MMCDLQNLVARLGKVILRQDAKKVNVYFQSTVSGERNFNAKAQRRKGVKFKINRRKYLPFTLKSFASLHLCVRNQSDKI